MTEKEILKYCKDLGCCDACCLRYLGLKNPTAYENAGQYVIDLMNEGKIGPNVEQPVEVTTTSPAEEASNTSAAEDTLNGSTHPEFDKDTSTTSTEVPKLDANGEAGHKRPAGSSASAPEGKRARAHVCVTCLGVLQPHTWPHAARMLQDLLQAKKYECDTFACALSSPLAVIVRERAVALRLADTFASFDDSVVTPLKEAWKWSFGAFVVPRLNMALDSGAVSPLLLTVTLEYEQDLQEVEVVKRLSPSLFEIRGRQRRRFTVEFTRRSVEQALDGVTLERLVAAGGVGPGVQSAGPEAQGAGPRAAGAPAMCVAVHAEHAPLYLGGRYVKRSRALPQTPWLVAGRRVMPSSVQECIFQPLAKEYGMDEAEAERKLKFMSAGREDVDVRCLGRGRPFAIEISDPRRRLTADELRQVCENISQDRQVVVDRLVYVTRQQLSDLKCGEETKCKTYEALCVKLERGEDDDPAAPVAVSERDVRRLQERYAAPVPLRQRTPLRVLHRRALAVRARRVLALRARRVPGAPALLVLRLRTEAGTYVKEWAHGELGRTRPSLADALGARVDILALDVRDVELDWPPNDIQS